jgi:hypothetical protein
MRTKRLIYFLVFLLAFSLLIAPKGWTQPKPETKAPLIQRLFRATIEPFETEPKPMTSPSIITHAFAVEKGPYGYIWKIYIEAEAGDANMSRIAMVVDEPGAGRYPTDWIILKPQYQKHLKGCIQWNTHSASGHLQEWTLITLRVSIIDKAGNESNEVVFPFTFELGVKNPYQYKLPAPFDQGDIPRLGYIDTNLFPPGGMGDRASRFW